MDLEQRVLDLERLVRNLRDELAAALARITALEEE